MSLVELIKELKYKKIKIDLEGDKLKINGPKENLTPDLIQNIRALKDDLIRFLKDRNGMEVTNSIPNTPIEKFYDVSHGQRRLWVLSNIDTKNSVAYNLPIAYVIDGDLKLDAWNKAFNILIDSFEILRTNFWFNNGDIQQIVRPTSEINFNIEFSNYIGKDLNSLELSTIVINEFHKPFDLEKDLLLRSKIFQIEEQKFLFLLTIHHIICDGWSLHLMLTQISQIYKSLILNEKPISIEPAIHYKDYSVWFNDLLKQGYFNNQREFWFNKLSNEIPKTCIETDFIRPVNQTFNGSKVTTTIPKSTYEGIKLINKNSHTTTFMLLLAVVKSLIYRYTQNEDIIIGTPVAGRINKDLEKQIGFFVNTIPIRTKVDADSSFKELLLKIKNETIAAFENQEYPIDIILDDLNLKRDLAHNPLFDILFVFQNINALESDGFKIEGLTLNQFPTNIYTSKLDLIIEFIEYKDYLELNIQYNTDLFLEQRINNFATHIQSILNSVLLDIEQPINAIKYLSSEELENINAFHKSSNSIPDLTIIDYFNQQVGKNYDKTAVVSEGKKLSFGELDTHSDIIASILQEKGLYKEVVAFVADRSVNSIVYIIGILKAGCAYLPIDLTLPINRIEYILHQSQAKVLLSEFDFEVNFPGEVVLTNNYYLNTLSDKRAIFDSKDLAYVIYTSGSTGQPKGVTIRHESVTNLVNSLSEEIYSNYEGHLNIALISPFVFDASVKQIFVSLLSGFTLYIVPEEIRLSPDGLINFYIVNQIDISDGTPLHLFAILDLAKQNNLKIFPKHFIIGGEALPVNIVNDMLTVTDKKTLISNVYGPTECCVDVSCFTVKDLILGPISRISIGKPLNNIKIYILDNHKREVPLGITGELYVGGICVSSGYLNDQDLTKQKFILSPFNLNEILYKTGDIGKWNFDGTIDLLGRVDNQVKLRGYRIELDEIKNILLKNKNIKDAVVRVLDVQGSSYIVAYIIDCSKDNDLTVVSIKEFLKEFLPSYMVPTYILKIDKVPYSFNGKVDFKLLPDVLSEDVLENKDLELPSSGLEKVLFGIWKEILNRNNFGINSNFFELGGHSIKAIQIISRIYKELSFKIPIKVMFEKPTIKELAKFILNERSLEEFSISKVEENAWYPVTFTQRIQFLKFLFSKEPNVENKSVRINLKSVKPDLVELTFQEILKRHESLRTTFLIEDGDVRQMVHKFNTEWRVVEFIDLSLNGYDKYDMLEGIFEEQKHIEFDLNKGPIFKVRLCKLDQDHYDLFFTANQIIFDGSCNSIIINEFNEIYGHISNNTRMDIDPLEVQLKDYSSWQFNHLLEKNKDYYNFWYEKLYGNVANLFLPSVNPYSWLKAKDFNYKMALDWELSVNCKQLTTDEYNLIYGSFSKVKFDAADSVSHSIKGDLLTKIRALGTKLNCTTYSLINSCLYILLYKLADSNDLIIGNCISLRDSDKVEKLIGFFNNIILCPIKLDHGSSYRDIVKAVNNNFIECSEYKNYPLEKVLVDLNLPFDKINTLLIDYLRIDNDTNEIVDVELDFSEGGWAIFNLNCFVNEYDNSICFTWVFSKDVFDKSIITSILRRFLYLVEIFVDDPDKILIDLDFDLKREIKCIN